MLIYSLYDQYDHFCGARWFNRVEDARKWKNDVSRLLGKWLYGVISKR